MTRGVAPGAFAVALSLTGCGAPPVRPTGDDLARAQSRFADLTADELSLGFERFSARCGSCHAHTAPSEIAPEHWAAQVEDMRERAHLSAEETRAVTRYLVAVATRPPETAPPAASNP